MTRSEVEQALARLDAIKSNLHRCESELKQVLYLLVNEAERVEDSEPWKVGPSLEPFWLKSM